MEVAARGDPTFAAAERAAENDGARYVMVGPVRLIEPQLAVQLTGVSSSRAAVTVHDAEEGRTRSVAGLPERTDRPREALPAKLGS